MKKFVSVLFVCLAVVCSVKAQEKKPNLWLLAVGINDYPDGSAYPDLGFCVSDAKKIVSAFRAQEGKVFGKVNVMLIADSEKTAPTKDNIMQGLKFFSGAAPEDIVVLYFAQHGFSAGGDFYLMPSDTRFESPENPEKSTLIKFSDIVNNSNAPGKKLFLLDTNEAAHALQYGSGKSAAVFASSRENEMAYESDLFDGGFFTYAITSGLGGAAADNGAVTIGSLADFVTKRVGTISRDRQHPAAYLPEEMKGIVLGTN
jgi:uncharacterized caspase-like protein